MTDVAYIVIGEEIGKECGTPHLQGYVEFSKKKRLKAVSRMIPRARITPRWCKKPIDAANYCKKEKLWLEEGILSSERQGARNDLDEVRQEALDGGMRAIVSTANYQQIRVAEKFLTYCEEPRDWKPKVIWLHGATGVGKTRAAYEMVSDDVYVKKEGSKWWEGYDAHEDVIIDDFKGWWTLEYLLALLDRYEMRVEYKGGTRQFKAKLIVITSSHPPEYFFKGIGEDLNQLVRRCDEIIEVTE